MTAIRQITQDEIDEAVLAGRVTPEIREAQARPKFARDAASEHTPGPWRPFTRYVLANGRFLATAHAIGDSGSTSKGFAIGQEPIQDMNEAEANAKLIAAAPETAAERDKLREQVKALLTACKQALPRAYVPDEKKQKAQS